MRTWRLNTYTVSVPQHWKRLVLNTAITQNHHQGELIPFPSVTDRSQNKYRSYLVNKLMIILISVIIHAHTLSTIITFEVRLIAEVKDCAEFACRELRF